MITRCFLISALSMLSLSNDVLAQRKSCPLGRFCPVGVNCTSNPSVCVVVCATHSDYMQQGNWTTGNCERSKCGVLFPGGQ